MPKKVMTGLGEFHNAPRSNRRPEFRQLEAFLKVTETRSFAEAARQLGISQPAVSQAIARLEELYGGDLFVRRRGSPVTLTPIGQAILSSAKLLLFTVDRQIDRAFATAQSRAGSLTVGIHPALAFGPVIDSLVEFARSARTSSSNSSKGRPETSIAGSTSSRSTSCSWPSTQKSTAARTFRSGSGPIVWSWRCLRTIHLSQTSNCNGATCHRCQ